MNHIPRGYPVNRSEATNLVLRQPKRIMVRFDAPIDPDDDTKVLSLRGCDARFVQQLRVIADGYIVTAVIEARQVGGMRVVVDATQARSADDIDLLLDGNQDPGGVDHVGPNGDDFEFELLCFLPPIPGSTTSTTSAATTTTTSSTSSTTTTSTTAPTTTISRPRTGDDSAQSTTTTATSTTTTPATTTTTAAPTTTTTAVAARHRLVVRAHSFEIGPLPTDQIAVAPAQADYADGQQVTLDAPEQFSSDGHRHFFVEWQVIPSAEVAWAASGTHLVLTMSQSVTVTAVYESVPE